MAVCVLVKVCTLVGNFSDPLPGDFDFGTYSISDTLWEEKQCEMGSTTLELDVFYIVTQIPSGRRNIVKIVGWEKIGENN